MSKIIYKQRRENLSTIIPNNSAIIISGADNCYRNADSAYAFRQESSFYYLSGFCEASSVMLLINENNKIKSIIFVPQKDKIKEIWDGYRAGPDGAVNDYLFDAAFNNSELDKEIPGLIQGKQKLFYSFGKDQSFDKKVIEWTNIANSIERHSKSIDMVDSTSLIGNLRLIKDSHEIELLKRSCEISADSHISIMKSIQPGNTEQEIEAKYLYEFAKRGSRFAAYTPIVAGGENACILHYVENNQPLKDGELILVDAGGEYEMYASDITRTFPVNGKFTKEQLAIYNVVYEANQKAISAVIEGNNIMEPQKISEKVIVNGLVDLGILKGDPDDLYNAGAHKEFYMHKVGHWLGLDVHDSGDYMENGDFMFFKPGMVTTVEPGIYISSSAKVEDRWKGIGIRIEDDILVTEGGNVNLTEKVPSDPKEIETLMA